MSFIVEQESRVAFKPIIITITTLKEAKWLKDVIGKSTPVGFPGQDLYDGLTKLLGKVD